jgi:hypothetical protein
VVEAGTHRLMRSVLSSSAQRTAKNCRRTGTYSSRCMPQREGLRVPYAGADGTQTTSMRGWVRWTQAGAGAGLCRRSVKGLLTHILDDPVVDYPGQVTMGIGDQHHEALSTLRTTVRR